MNNENIHPKTTRSKSSAWLHYFSMARSVIGWLCVIAVFSALAGYLIVQQL